MIAHCATHPWPGRCATAALRPAILSLWVVAVALLLATGAPRAAAELPERMNLVYSLSRGTLEIARVEETYERSGRNYRLLSEARAVGVAALLARGQGWRRESRGTVSEAGLRPDVFTDQRGNNPVLRARFDWQVNQVRFDRPGANGSPDQAAGEPESVSGYATDRLSFPYALAQRAALPPGEWEVAMTDGRRLSRYRFAVAGRETVQTPAGTFDALRISRVREKDDSATDVWLAVDRGMIPVRILVTEPDGSTFDQVLVKMGTQ